MCGGGGVTGRPRDPGGGAASRPVQIPREPGPRPRAPRPRAQPRLLARAGVCRAAGGGRAVRGPERSLRRGGEDAEPALESRGGRARSVRAARGAGLGPRKRGRVGDPEEPGGAREVDGSRFFLRGFFQNQSLRSGEILSALGVARSSRRGGQCRRQKLAVRVKPRSAGLPCLLGLPGGVIFDSVLTGWLCLGVTLSTLQCQLWVNRLPSALFPERSPQKAKD